MAHPSPKVLDLARRLATCEAGDMPDPAASAAAVESVFRKLKDNLGDVLGSHGFSALAGRALSLARRTYPFLAGVTWDAEAFPHFVGLEQALAGVTARKAAAASVTILAHLIGVLVLLLGEDLGIQPIRKLWPHVASSFREIDE